MWSLFPFYRILIYMLSIWTIFLDLNIYSWLKRLIMWSFYIEKTYTRKWLVFLHVEDQCFQYKELCWQIRTVEKKTDDYGFFMTDLISSSGENNNLRLIYYLSVCCKTGWIQILKSHGLTYSTTHPNLAFVSIDNWVSLHIKLLLNIKIRGVTINYSLLWHKEGEEGHK